MIFGFCYDDCDVEVINILCSDHGVQVTIEGIYKKGYFSV